MNMTITTKTTPLIPIRDVPMGHFFQHSGGAIGFVGSTDGTKSIKYACWFYNYGKLTGWPCANLDVLVKDLGPVEITLENLS